jgi:DNA-binding IclR family transcriptional regulator
MEGKLVKGVNSVAVTLKGPSGPHLGISGVAIAGQVSHDRLRQLGADLHAVVTAYSTRRGWLPLR